jgi:hypothetical protein
VDRLDRQKKYFRCHQLAGFWGRFADLVLKVGLLYALAQREWVVRLEDVERAEALLRYRLAPPLEGLVEELDASPEHKRMLDLQDSLDTSGPEGWAEREFFRRTGKTGRKAQREMLEGMISLGLAWQHAGRVYGRPEWATDVKQRALGH